MTMEKQAEAAAKFQQAVFTEMFVPKFIEKCAAQGITFKDEDELIAGLETAGMLKAAQAELQAKGIDTNPSPKKAVRDMLKQAMFGEQAQPQDLSGVEQALAGVITAGTEAQPA
jgi:hypothetical protein